MQHASSFVTRTHQSYHSKIYTSRLKHNETRKKKSNLDGEVCLVSWLGFMAEATGDDNEGEWTT
jgi:hypothetical protein